MLTPLAWYAFLFQLPYAVGALRTGADVTRSYLYSTGELAGGPTGWWNTIAVGISAYYALYMFLFFAAIAARAGAFYVLSMFIGSTLYIVNSFVFAARDGIIWFLGSMFLCIWLFRPILSQRMNRLLKVLGVTLVIAGALILGLFTFQRFGRQSSENAVQSIFMYFGQQPYVFAETVSQQQEFYGLDLRFPLLAEMFGPVREIRRVSPYEWSFGTFARDFYSVAGWPTAFLLSGVLALTFALSFKLCPQHAALAYVILLTLYFQFMLQGIFYFRMGNIPGNIYIATMVVMASAMLITARRGRVEAVRRKGAIGRGTS